MALISSDVAPGDDIDADDHNFVRDDIQLHVHGGVDTAYISNESPALVIWNMYFNRWF